MNDSVADLLLDLPRTRSWVLPALLRVQRHFGHISADAIETVAAHLRLTASDLEGIASGYPDLRRTPPHGLVVRVCVGLTCALAGSDELSTSLKTRESELHIETNNVPCLFACAVAPVVELRDACVGRATLALVIDEIHDVADENSGT